MFELQFVFFFIFIKIFFLVYFSQTKIKVLGQHVYQGVCVTELISQSK